MKKILPVILLLSLGLSGFDNNRADSILGIWANNTNKGHLQLYKQNGKYYGKIIWLNQPLDENGKPKVDKNNPNKNIRNKSLLGLVMLSDFRYNDGVWTDGRLYNPNDGKEYNCSMKLKDEKTLAVRGYVGISLLGKTENFVRVR